MKCTFHITSPQSLESAIQCIREEFALRAQDGKALSVVASDPTRSLAQNAAMHPILRAWSRQIRHPVNGAMVLVSEADWKNIMTASFRNETQRISQGLDGGVVLLGASTREFKMGEFSEFLEFLHAASAQRGVNLGPRIERIDMGRAS